LIHLYVYPTGTALKTDANMNVVLGFPLNTWAAAASDKTANDGTEVVGTGLKLSIAATTVPVATHYATFVPRMIPFYKSTGGN
jgi:hypothetical protein